MRDNDGNKPFWMKSVFYKKMNISNILSSRYKIMSGIVTRLKY